MPYMIRWTANALSGLVRAHAFLAEVDAEAAQKALDAIEAATDVLEPDHRELLIPFGGSGYAVFYEVQGEEVLILALKHQREAGYGE